MRNTGLPFGARARLVYNRRTVMSRATVNVWIGTRKGAFVCRSVDRKRWNVEAPIFPGDEINHVVQDPRNPNIVFTLPSTVCGLDRICTPAEMGGKTWKLLEAGVEIKCLPDTSLKRIWYIQPGHAEEPGVVWAGEPGVLFRSADWGRNWTEVVSLTAH